MDNFTVAYGYRACYKYKCIYDSNGTLIEKRFFRCVPRVGMTLYKVVGTYPFWSYPFQCYRYFLGTSKEDVKQQYKIWYGWDADYANIVVDQKDIRRVLTSTYWFP